MRIRVNTDELNAASGRFESSADIIRQLGINIKGVADGLPSYDGQLSGPARAAGAAIQSQHQKLANDLLGDSQYLAQTAGAFEKTDREIVGVIEANQAFLAGVPLPSSAEALSSGGPQPLGAGGRKDVISYEDYGDYVVFWKDGKSITIHKNDQNLSMINQYEKDIDDLCLHCVHVAEDLHDMVTQSLALFPGIIMFLGLQGSSLTDFLKENFPDVQKYLDVLDKIQGLIGLDAQDALTKTGIIVPAFDPIKFGDDTIDFEKEVDLGNADYYDAEKIWDTLAT